MTRPIPDVSFITVSDRPNCLRHLISCLRLQSSSAWELLVLDQTPRASCAAPVLEVEALGETRVSWYGVPRIGDVGQSMKLAYSRFASGEFICVPNDDAYYVPGFVDRMVWYARSESLDMTYCDWIFDRADNTYSYQHMQGIPVTGRIDIGGFIVKRELLIADGWPDRGEGGDGRLVERLIARGAKHSVVPDHRVLYVKN